MKKLISVLLACAMLISMVSVNVAATATVQEAKGKLDSDVNLVLNSKAATKGTKRDYYASRPNSNLTDGDRESRCYVEKGGYIFVDLGEPKRIRSATIYEHNNYNGKGGLDRNRLKSFNIRYCTELSEEYAIGDHDSEEGVYVSDMPIDYITDETWPVAVTVTNDEAYQASEEKEVIEVSDFPWFTARYVMLQITDIWPKNDTDPSLDLCEWELYGGPAKTQIFTERTDTVVDNEEGVISVAADGAVAVGEFLDNITVVDALQDAEDEVTVQLLNGTSEVMDGNLADGMTLKLLADGEVTGTYQIRVEGGTAGNMSFKDIGGKLSQEELDAFVAYANTNYQTAQNNVGNAMAYGAAGADIDAMCMVYTITKDVRLLAPMIKGADSILLGRNDQPNGDGRELFTGNVEKAWPNKALGEPDEKYAGSENGLVLGHVAYVAECILNTPSIWEQEVPDSDPNGYGKTYLERAKTYAAMCDETIQEFLIPNFIEEGTLLQKFPSSPAFASMGGGIQLQRPCGKWIPVEPAVDV